MTLPSPLNSRTLATASVAGAALLALGAWLRQDNTAHARTLPSTLPPMTGPAPALFIGHGSPMNAIQTNRFTKTLTTWGAALGLPKAILMVSAHWLSERDTRVSTTAKPPMIYDFGGFPEPLYEVEYPAPGAPAEALKAAARLAPRQVGQDAVRGLDHGTWSVLKHLYPAADVPVFQLSIDITRDGAYHLALGRALAELRAEGVMIVGSGNVVHNLGILDEALGETERASTDWAQSFDDTVKQAMDAGDTKALAAWERLTEGARLAVPFPDHYFPMLYAAGAAQSGEKAKPIFEGFQEGTLSMRCVQWG